MWRLSRQGILWLSKTARKILPLDANLICVEGWVHSDDHDVSSHSSTQSSHSIQLRYWVCHNLLLLWLFQWISGEYCIYKCPTIGISRGSRGCERSCHHLFGNWIVYWSHIKLLSVATGLMREIVLIVIFSHVAYHHLKSDFYLTFSIIYFIAVFVFLPATSRLI